MIEVEGVTKRYGDLVAVDDVSFEVSPGEVVGFLGPNGAGKSTTMKVLTGTMQPDRGHVRFDGRSIAEDLPGSRRRVGYLPETNALYMDMLVSEYLEHACRLRDIDGPERARALGRAVGQTGVGPVFTRPISELSKGFRQRVGLAAAIVHEPEILVLDEPTEGLDPNQRVGIRRLVRELGRDRTVILSTHVLAEVEATCDRLLIIHRGRIVADGSAETLLDQRRGGARYVVEVEGDGVVETLESVEGVTSVDVERVDGRLRAALTASGADDLRPHLFRTAADRGWVLWELHRERESLERLFQVLTTEGGGGDAPAEDESMGTDEPDPVLADRGGDR